MVEELSQKETRWTRERELVDAITRAAGEDCTAKLRPAVTQDGATGLSLAELRRREEELRSVQGEAPLVHADVNSQAISETVAAWTGIPVGRMMADQISTVLNLKSLMERQIVGQSHALERIAQSIRTSRANLTDPRTPIGVFLLAGTSGVGKTETAIVLAELLYGGEQNMTVINMSEFKEEHKVSLLMGSPPGLRRLRRRRRADRGGATQAVLGRAARRDGEGHPGVQDIFYQVFDKGTLRDGEGRDIDFRNTVILMTTNAGTDLIKSLCRDPDTAPDPDGFVTALFPELLKTFKPAFLGRVTIIPVLPAVGRGHAADHRAQAREDRPPDRGALQGHVLLRAGVGRHDRAALHRGRHRGAQHRPHPDEDAAAGDVGGVSGAHGGRKDDPGGQDHGRRR